MSMHHGIDLSRFKKVASDKKCTTLQHDKGHEIRIAHSGVSPKMMEALKKLPVHLAGGGDPADPNNNTPAPDETDAIELPTEAGVDDESGPTQAPITHDQPPAEDVVDPASEVNNPQPAAADTDLVRGSGAPPKPSALPDGGQIDVVGQKAKALDNDDALYAQDLQRGHITPETYQGLFAKKDTLGKIGTLFGLLVSGAGSGITGQPNAVMEMMNKEIERDLAAQQHSNENTQNFLRLSQQHALNQSAVQLQAAQAQLAKAQASKVPSEIAEATERLKLIKNQAAEAGSNASKNIMTLTALQELYGTTGKLPPGATKDVAAQHLGALGQAAATANAQNNLSTAQKQQAQTDAFNRRNDLQRMVGQGANASAAEARHIPGIGDAAVPLTSEDRSKINAGLTFQNEVAGLRNWAAAHKGTLKPTDIEAGMTRAQALQQAYRASDLGGVFKPSEKELLERAIPNNPVGLKDWLGLVEPILQTTGDVAKTRLDQHLKSLGAPPSPIPTPSWRNIRTQKGTGKRFEQLDNGRLKPVVD